MFACPFSIFDVIFDGTPSAENISFPANRKVLCERETIDLVQWRPDLPSSSCGSTTAKWILDIIAAPRRNRPLLSFTDCSLMLFQILLVDAGGSGCTVGDSAKMLSKQEVAWNRNFISLFIGWGGERMNRLNHLHTLRGSFSALSTQIFANEYSLH